MSKHDLSRIRVTGDVVDPLAELDDQEPENPAAAALRIRYYDPATNEPLPLDQIERRIRKNAERMNRLSVEMMFDLYFVHANWGSFYNRTDSFSKWLENSVDLSRSYAYDIIKVVRTMIAFAGEASDGDGPLQIEEIGSRIEEIGLKKMKLISQIPDQEARYAFLRRALSGEPVRDNEIIERSRELLDSRSLRHPHSLSSVTIPTMRIDSILERIDRDLTDAEEVIASHPVSPPFSASLQREAQRTALQLLGSIFLDTPLQSKINRVRKRHGA
jgi:hypothetical protein